MKKLFFFFMLLLIVLKTNAQCIQYTYDAAGDRTARNICPAAVASPNIQHLVTLENGVHNTSGIIDLEIFPNPTTGSVHLKTASFPPESKVLITDVLGRIFRKGYLQEGSWDISALQSGRYFIWVSDKERSRVVIVVKE